MSEETMTKAEHEAALAKMQESIERLEAKNAELVGDLRKARKSSEIRPEDLAAAEERADRAEAALADATKQVKALTAERDKAVKALETESGAARAYALEAEINGAIASGNVLPALVPALKAMVAQQAKADLVDGKYSVLIGDKPATDYIKAFLDSDDGKAFRAAPVNGGGGAPGGNGPAFSGKTILRAEYDALPMSERAAMGLAAAKGEVKIVDAAA